MASLSLSIFTSSLSRNTYTLFQCWDFFISFCVLLLPYLLGYENIKTGYYNGVCLYCDSCFGARPCRVLYKLDKLGLDFVKFVNGANRDWPKSQHTDTDFPAKYLENKSSEQLYPLNNIGSTPRALYSEPKLSWRPSMSGPLRAR